MALDAVRAGHRHLRLSIRRPASATVPTCGRVLSLKSRVARVIDVRAGRDASATGARGRPSARRRIALIMCGYADGYRRALSNRAHVLIGGQRAPIAGRIAMDMCMADVTDIAGVAPDDEAVIIGAQGGERIDADELAALADTISWEILAGISARVPRLYLRGGRPVAATRR